MSKLAGIILAAGTSSRFGERNKLLCPYRGQAMVRWAAAAAITAGLEPVIVVTGCDAANVQLALEGLALEFVHNDGFADGQAGSLRTGIAAVPDSCSGAMILLGDMPDVSADIIEQLMDGFAGETEIVVPRYEGMRGNPVVLGRAHFAGLDQISGDRGARELLTSNAVRFVDIASQAVLRDFDTPDMLEEHN